MVKIEPASQQLAETDAASRAHDKLKVQGDVKVAQDDNERAKREVDLDLVDELRALIKAEFQANSDKYAPNHYEEIMNPSSALTCWRYISHKAGSISDAFELMKESLRWRKENEIDDLDRSELIKEFWHFTPISLCGKTREGRALLYVVGKHYRKPHAKLKGFIPKFCGNILFGWDREHNLDLERLHVIFDVTDTGYRNIDLDFMNWLVAIKDFLPGRWYQFSVVGIPFIIRPLIHLVLSWVDETYRQMTHLGGFDKLVREVIDWDNLPVEVGGTRDETYKLAPLDAPWASESPVFSSAEMLKHIEDCILMNDTKRAEMRKLQLEHDSRLLSLSEK